MLTNHTQILTKDGFEDISQITTSTEVGCYDDKGNISFQKPNLIISEDVENEIIYHIFGEQYEQIVGHGHEVIGFNNYGIIKSRVEDIKLTTLLLPVNGKNKDYAYDVASDLDLLFAYMFGIKQNDKIHLDISDYVIEKRGYLHTVKFIYLRDTFLTSILDKLHIDSTKSVGEYVSISFYYKKRLGIDLDWFNPVQYSPSVISELLVMMFNGLDTPCYSMPSKIELEKVQLACVLSKNYVTIYKDNMHSFIMVITKRNVKRIGSGLTIRELEYSGMLHSIKVPTGMVVCRQDYKPFITGCSKGE